MSICQSSPVNSCLISEWVFPYILISEYRKSLNLPPVSDGKRCIDPQSSTVLSSWSTVEEKVEESYEQGRTR